jgi:hypothetical protein
VTVIDALSNQAKRLPKEPYRSLTCFEDRRRPVIVA